MARRVAHSQASQTAVDDKNAKFFSGNTEYATAVARLAYYRNLRRLIDEELTAVGSLIDIGNGGVFDYDTSIPKRIVAVDLFVDSATSAIQPPHIEMRTGNALALPEADNCYDAAIIVLVLHHLVEDSPGSLVDNARRALIEAQRVLRPGGKFILAESCVPEWFYAVERVAIGSLVRLSASRYMKHPPAMQMPIEVLRELMSDVFVDVEARRVAPGPFILQFGKRWPTALTPANVAHYWS